MSLPVALVVHGHFYQPPRENPWTDQMDREPSAAPHHDWNARIHAECYRANAFARIHDATGRIEAIVNNYARLSFNFGPTLARWLPGHDGNLMEQLVAADVEQRHRLGHGGAIAQAYAHPIVPLLSPRDRQTQLLWGLQDFRRRYGRDAEGLWLPETAVSPASLESLIELGVTFTILAPEQIAAVRGPGDPDWVAVDRDSLDTGRIYRWTHRDGSGRAINIAVFDGPLSRQIAFGEVAGRAETFLDAVGGSAERSAAEGQRLVLCASDGELFGHHKKFADLTLAFATYVEAARRGIEVTNLSAFIARYPPEWEVKLGEGPDGEGTAWSCTHGVGRWQRDCGCNMSVALGWNQKWRAPLREALDLLRDAAAGFYEDAAAPLLIDPWGARDAYGAVVDAGIPERDRVLGDFARPELARDRGGARDRARLLLEIQRATLLMYASCGWFFDDVAGLEASLVIRFGAYAIDLFKQAGGKPPVDDFVDILATAKSNVPKEGTGADVYRRVIGDRVTARHAVAFSGIARLIDHDGAASAPPRGFAVEILDAHPSSSAAGPSLAGRARAVALRTGVVEEHPFSIVQRRIDGPGFECRVGSEKVTLSELGGDRRDLLVGAAIDKALHGAAATVDAQLARLALQTFHEAPPEQEGSVRRRQELLAVVLIGLLAREAGSLSSEEITLARDLLDAAQLSAGSAHRRKIEELVWQHIAAGIAPDSIAPLAERLGFSAEAIGAESAAAT